MKKTNIMVMALVAIISFALYSCEIETEDNHRSRTRGGNNTSEQPEVHFTPGEWIDLGLPSGLLWASHNVGATRPEEEGDLFAWGESQPKTDGGDWYNYRYCYDGDAFELTKYCNNFNYGYNGFTDNLTTLQPSDDAATANWGNGAHTPTFDEWQELLYYCIIAEDWIDGQYGYRITGPNGNIIFLCAGWPYWSASLDTSDPTGAWGFSWRTLSLYRCDTYAVRPVRSAR